MEPYVSTHQFTSGQKVYLKTKRVIDFIFAVVLLIVLSPVMLLCALWIKLDSPGPIIFKQRRPGYHQKIFTIYKLRSMRVDTTASDGRALKNEERATKSGTFVRKTSIDELPQLINIIKGEMSFIGPRPFLINDLGSYTIEQLIRFEVLPGITSWTAIHGRGSISANQKYNYEIEYVRRIGPRIDFEIFLKTLVLVFSQKDIEDSVERIGAQIIDDKKTEKAE